MREKDLKRKGETIFLKRPTNGQRFEIYDKKKHGLTVEHREAISEAKKGKTHSGEAKDNMSKGRTQAWAKDSRKITDQQKAAIIRMRQSENKMPKEIADLLGMNRKTVSKILLKAGISSTKPKQ
jgi:DNA-binding CsgD family transcriptional regulator